MEAPGYLAKTSQDVQMKDQANMEKAQGEQATCQDAMAAMERLL